MPPNTNREAVASAVLERTPTPGVTRTPEQARGDAIRVKVQESGARSALEDLRGRETVEKGNIDYLIDTNIGVERDTSGKKTRNPGSDEEKRFNDATKATELTKDLLENGYDAAQGVHKDAARDLVERAIRAWPEGNDLLAGLSNPEVRQLIENVLKDPDFSNKLKDVFSSVTNPDKQLQDLVTDTKSKLEEVLRLEAVKQAEIDQNNTNLAAIDAQLNEYRTGGAKQHELQQINSDLPQMEQDKIVWQDEHEDLNDRFKDLTYRRRAAINRGDDTTALDDEITTIRGEMRQVKRELDGINERVNRKQFLENEWRTLAERKKEIDSTRVQLDSDMSTNQINKSKAQADHALKKGQREGQEDNFVNDLEDAVTEATTQYLEDQIRKAEAVEKQLIEAEIARTEDPAEKAILEAILDRWEKTETVGILKKSQIKVNDRDKINRDFSTLMTSGPKEIMREMMMNAGITQADIDAKLNDPAFIEKMQPQVAERLISYKLQTGKINSDEARRIFNSAWGENMIDNALSRNKKLKDQISKLEAEGVLQGGIKEWMRKASKGELWRFLLILFGATVAGAVGLAAAPAVLGAASGAGAGYAKKFF